MSRYRGLAWRAAALALVMAPAAGRAAQDMPSLASERGCMACHGLVRRQVGPGFAQIAARYRADAEAPARLVGKVRGGAVGAWGRVIMPPQSQVSEAEAKLLVAWVLSQPSPP